MNQRARTTATTGFVPRARLSPPTFTTGEIAIAAPPQRLRSSRTGSLIKLLPVASAVAMVAMTVMVVRSGSGMARTPMFVGFPLMMLVSAGVTALAGRGHRPAAEVDGDRADYLRYLSGLRTAVAATAAAQRASLLWRHPSPDSLWTLVGGRRMWERRPADSDFGDVRIGVGAQSLGAQLVTPQAGPGDRSDPVTAVALSRFVRTHSTIAGAPVTIMLPSLAAVTIDGDATYTRAVLRAMICQLAVLHGPHRILIAGVIGEDQRASWDWLKWLPHNQHPSAADIVGPARMVYPHLTAAASALAEVLRDRVPSGQRTTGSPMVPHVVVVVDGAVVDDDDPILNAGGIEGVTVVEAGTRYDRVATTRGLRLRVTSGSLTSRAVGERSVFARPDQMDIIAALVCARRLAGYRLDGVGAGHDPPDGRLTWHDLLGIENPADFNPMTMWDQGNRRDRLRVPIGTSASGGPVELDIKEAARNGMGPHGLCVGATGSGKSELLRTVVLGMIARHSPETLNLALVDFKGGATFLDLERAPHVAAVITNLASEASLVARMTDALTGEMNRRQEILRAAGNAVSVAEYERTRRAGAPLAALPTLFIVVDEFSELLSQHPDFADVFSAIGRLGRSLGMHLLLASQRLDEGRLRGLESHISYRICLKTLSATESRSALGTPDAYQLPNTPGAAYLRCATGELIRFQTACVSVPCRVSQDAAAPAANQDTASASVHVFSAEPVGPVLAAVASSAEPTATRTVLQTIVGRLSGHGPAAHQVWLPPLGAPPALHELIAHRHPDRVNDRPLRVPIGIVDRPFEQRRAPLIVELSGAAGNVAVVGAPQSGKSTALRTLITALAATHDARQVQFYCLDFGGGALAALRRLPHVGSIAGRTQPELVARTVAELDAVVRAREVCFRDHGIDSMTRFRTLRARRDPIANADPFGDVFLVIDGWAALRDELGGLEASITAIAAQGLSFGVHVVLSASRWAEIRPALKDQIGTRIELRLGDPADSVVDRKQAVGVPENRPGSGLSRAGLHMMIALPRLDRPEPSSADDQPAAPPIRLLPTHVDQQTVVAGADSELGSRILLGLKERDLGPVPLDFDRHGHLLILGDCECGKTTALRTICREVVRTKTTTQAQLLVVDFRRGLLGAVEPAYLSGYAISAAALTALLPGSLDMLRQRMPGTQVTQQKLRTRSWWSGPEIYVLVDDYDLIATAAHNPLTPLVEYLPYAADVGLHLVLARRSGAGGHVMFDPMIAGLRNVGCMGLMMSADPTDGLPLGAGAPERLPAGRGTLITRSDGERRVQVGWSPPP